MENEGNMSTQEEVVSVPCTSPDAISAAGDEMSSRSTKAMGNTTTENEFSLELPENSLDAVNGGESTCLKNADLKFTIEIMNLPNAYGAGVSNKIGNYIIIPAIIFFI